MAYQPQEPNPLSRIAYGHNSVPDVPGLSQPVQALAACEVPVTAEPVVLRLLEVYRGMQAQKAQEAVQKTAGPHSSIERWVEALRDLC